MPEDDAKSEAGSPPEDGAPRWRTVLKRIGAIRLALAAVFLVTLAVPATREMHILTFRLLFRIPGWRPGLLLFVHRQMALWCGGNIEYSERARPDEVFRSRENSCKQ